MMNNVFRCFNISFYGSPMYFIIKMRISLVLVNFLIDVGHAQSSQNIYPKNEMLTGKGSFLVVR